MSRERISWRGPAVLPVSKCWRISARRSEPMSLSEAAISALAEDAPSPESLSEREDALEGCLEKLTPKMRDLLWRRYSRRQSSTEMAEAAGMTSTAVRVALSKARVALRDCINSQTPTSPVKDPMKEKDNNSELDALIDACLDGRLSEAEADRLSQWIEESSEARERYWELASVHGMIEQSMQSASLKAATGEEFVTAG